MMKTEDDALRLARAVFGTKQLPKPFLLLGAASEVDNGGDIRRVAKALRTTASRIDRLRRSPDRLKDAFGISLAEAAGEKIHRNAKKGLGQMLLGQLAERTFEEIYGTTMRTTDLTLVDSRGGRNDTDYRVHNGSGKPVFRINIKFHGTEFRNARELVGLEPSNCFALATYKVHQGLTKQHEEALPYIFRGFRIPCGLHMTCRLHRALAA